VGEALRLPAGESAHAHARRLSSGDPVVLFDGKGGEMLGRVSRLSRSGIEVLAERVLDPADPGPPVALYVAAGRVERLSWMAEKATELAVARLVLVRAERTQAFRATETLRERLERVARAAAKQCGAPRCPEIVGPLPMSDALQQETARHRFLLDPEGQPFPAALASAPAALAVGPEGGWTRPEVEVARDLGWNPTSLPAGRLRAETAVIAGLVLLRAALSRATGLLGGTSV
jgi:16S rRNA (uracil1498-N3)-methyltransferase